MNNKVFKQIIYSNCSIFKWVFISFTCIFLSGSALANSACELYIDRVVIGDCEYGPRTGNISKVIVAVFLRWSSPPPGTNIVVRLKGQTKNFDPFEKACPNYVQFILDADGSSQIVQASFNLLSNCVATPVNIILPQACDPPVCNGLNSIGGKVFIDYNNNGIQEQSENGLANVPIKIYDDNKNLIASTRSLVNGIWSAQNLVSGTKVRIEFTPGSDLYDSNIGMDNRTRTQRSTIGNCNVNLGIFALENLIEENPWIITAVMSKGQPTDPSSNAVLNPAIVANTFNTSSGGPRLGPNGNYNIASAAEVGSIWGLAYQKETKNVFSSAFLKRNSVLGPGGLGAIYVTDLKGFLPVPMTVPGFNYYGNTKMFLNLDSFGISTGDESKLIRDIGIHSNTPSHDSISFNLVGKWGLGDLDLNDRGDTLYAVNMHNRTLIIINIGNPYVYPITADRIQEITIPSSSCSDSAEWRPWGLKYKDGSIYIGGVCSAENSQNQNDLTATIYKYSNGTFTSFVHFDLFYNKGSVYGNCRTFRPWLNNYYSYHVGGNVGCGPVPVLSDIEFDSEGNLLVALGDRFGYQTGGKDFATKRNDKVAYINFSGGDLLKFFKLKDEYLLEKNGTVGYFTTSGANNNQGICKGEFFYEDGFFGHEESMMGGLAIHPSYNSIIATMMDPQNTWSNGWSQMNNSKGQKIVNYNIVTGENGTFGKSAGLGDVEVLTGSTVPRGFGVSIGNFIWEDLDEDGLQDPGEPPVVNLPILLFDSLNTFVTSTKSDLLGEYYFKNLLPFTAYTIQLGVDSLYQNLELFHNNKIFSGTKIHNTANYGNINNDSDGAFNQISGSPFENKLIVEFRTGDNGENDFSLDIGLSKCRSLVRDTVHYQICSSDSILVDTIWLSRHRTDAELYIQGGSRFGCDSIVKLYVELLPEKSSLLDTTICRKTSIELHGKIFNEDTSTGTIVLSGAASTGCDSLIRVQVQFHSLDLSHLDYTICQGDSIMLYQQKFDSANASGIVQLVNRYGCDSILFVNLTILKPSEFNLDTSLCRGSSIKVGNLTMDENNVSGRLMLRNANQYGCDSVVNIQVSILEQSSSRLDTSICKGSTLTIGNLKLDTSKTSGTLLLPNSNSNKCDSMVHVFLTIREPSTYFLDTSMCEHSQLELHNKIFNKYHTRDSIFLLKSNSRGCDSIIYVELNLIKQPTKNVDTILCENDVLRIDNEVFDKTRSKGQIVYPSNVSNVCDSILDISLHFNPIYFNTDSLDACDEYYWPVDGNTYTADQHIIYKYLSRSGCDSTHQLYIKIHPSSKQLDSVCTLNQYYWSIDGNQYKKSGLYEKRLSSVYGCDSIRLLYLELLGEGEVYVPNVFSPNGDGVNDILNVFANRDVKLIDVFRVFDRWGELMYELFNFMPNNTHLGWDGTHRSQDANPSVFVYYVEWRDKLGGKHRQTGDATLLR
ncbi:MAG: gliding motility-associated C-terminal domain-containing protein [Saprospiraceae bacterium]|nr:gliding motility-associated C-terminal domain-containing protein [Saprospiraceae bacterium]